MTQQKHSHSVSYCYYLQNVPLGQAMVLSLGRYDLERMRKPSSCERMNMGCFLDRDSPCTCEPLLVFHPMQTKPQLRTGHRFRGESNWVPVLRGTPELEYWLLMAHS